MLHEGEVCSGESAARSAYLQRTGSVLQWLGSVLSAYCVLRTAYCVLEYLEITGWSPATEGRVWHPLQA
jgi:hypothetical protein